MNQFAAINVRRDATRQESIHDLFDKFQVF